MNTTKTCYKCKNLPFPLRINQTENNTACCSLVIFKNIPSAHLCWTKDGGYLQFSVVLLFPGVNDQSDVAAAVGGKLPERSDDVVLDRKPGPHPTSFISIFNMGKCIGSERNGYLFHLTLKKQ